MPKSNKIKLKSIMVTEEIHQRVLKRKFKKQTELEEEVGMNEIITELLNQTEEKELKKIS